jgi:hypothetical protein
VIAAKRGELLDSLLRRPAERGVHPRRRRAQQFVRRLAAVLDLAVRLEDDVGVELIGVSRS